MAVEAQRVKDRLKAKFGTVQLSNQRLDAIAAKLAPKIADEAEDDLIDGELSDLNDLYPFLEIKKADDRAANEKHKQQQSAASTNPTPAQPSANQNTDDKANQEPESEIAKLTQLVTTLVGTVNAMQQEKQAQTITDRFKKDERLKGVPEFMFKGRIPSKEDDFETAVTDLATDYTEFAKQNKLAAFGNDAPPAGNGKVEGKQASKAELDAVGL